MKYTKEFFSRHTQSKRVYERAHSSQTRHGDYVLAEGSGGFRVSFSLAELDSDFQDSEVMIVVSLNGVLLADNLAPCDESAHTNDQLVRSACSSQ